MSHSIVSYVTICITHSSDNEIPEINSVTLGSSESRAGAYFGLIIRFSNWKDKLKNFKFKKERYKEFCFKPKIWVGHLTFNCS